MNRRKSKLRTAAGLAALALIAALFYLVGAVEQGAALSRMIWTVPLLAALDICARLYNRI